MRPVKAWLLALAIVLGSSPAIAESKKKQAAPAKQDKAPEPEPPVEEAPVGASDEAIDPLEGIPHVKGPKLVSLHAEIEIDLPAGAILFEQAQAVEIVRQGGGETEGVIGALVHPEKNWLVLIEYAPIGHVSDSDAADLDAAEMLVSYKKGTLEQNKKRVAMGVPELFVDNWSEPPRYERAQRHLVWGLNAHTNEGKVINFFTRILGRGGFISVNLIDDPAAIEASKAETAPLRDAIRFKDGFRYEDYREGDKSSGLGLKALVLGGGAVAAKKAGVLAGLLVVFKKVFVFIAVGIGAAFRWLFGRKKKHAEAPPETPIDPPSEPPPSDQVSA